MSYHLDAFASATEMLHALRTRQVSAVELLDLHLQRIERYNPQLNVIVIANIVNAFPHTDAPYDERRLDVNGEAVKYGRQMVYPSLGNLSAHPATAFPIGLTRSGLPIGLQAIGPYLEDRTPIRFAALVAREFGGFRRPPGYDGD